ncbi:MAG TPA: beta-N-acetylhexosaminidase [Burkholderiales bacterium]|nr:beta-N-acetylhexosaminidase [Burkholderiales bacterium]
MTGKVLPLGPLMLDISGTELTADDRRRLLHPLTGGVILFTRNYSNSGQLAQLTGAIHGLRSPALIIGVDHEGGRIQRFREGFTAIPPMRALGTAWNVNPQRARQLATETGFVLAAELQAHGLDLSFAPVLDVDHGQSSVIGDRALHSDPRAVAELGRALLHGFRQAGMAGVGKHFPGHGHVRADSHHEVPVDERTYEEIETSDVAPFRRLIDAGMGGIMPAHVIYPRIDSRPAGYSEIWLKQVLRGKLGFGGMVFSDDLSMEAARVAGGVVERARAAFSAGCDMALLCNDPAAADELLANLDYTMPAVALARLARMHGKARSGGMTALREDGRYAHALHAIAGLGSRDGDLPLST